MSVQLEKIYYTAMRKYGMKLVAGTSGIWNNVSWIHAVEDSAVIDFLKGQELVLITGIKLLKEEELICFTKNCYEQEASGLVFNIGPYIKQVPEEVISFAEEMKFPVFTLPWEVHLVDFNREFCNMIFQVDQQEQNLCSAFRTAIFSPEKTSEYMLVLNKEGISVNEKYCLIKCMPQVENIGEEYDSSKLFYDLRLYCERILNRMQKRYVVFRHDVYLTIVISDVGKPEVDEMLKEIMQFGKWQNHKGKLYFAVSDYKLQIGELSEYYETLGWMCKLECKENQQVWYMEELGIYSLLFSAKSPHILEKYKKSNLGALEKYDLENGTDYCNILYAYLKSNGKMQEVADQCFLHRNTVSYHLKKISEILECNLYSTEDRVRLYLALQIKDILEL